MWPGSEDDFESRTWSRRYGDDPPLKWAGPASVRRGMTGRSTAFQYAWGQFDFAQAGFTVSAWRGGAASRRALVLRPSATSVRQVCRTERLCRLGDRRCAACQEWIPRTHSSKSDLPTAVVMIVVGVVFGLAFGLL